MCDGPSRQGVQYQKIGMVGVPCMRSIIVCSIGIAMLIVLRLSYAVNGADTELGGIIIIQSTIRTPWNLGNISFSASNRFRPTSNPLTCQLDKTQLFIHFQCNQTTI